VDVPQVIEGKICHGARAFSPTVFGIPLNIEGLLALLKNID
jgi:hypothetical protein